MQSPQPRTVESISLMREQEDLPFIRADCDGLVIETNQRFRAVYGWQDDDLEEIRENPHILGDFRFFVRRPPSGLQGRLVLALKNCWGHLNADRTPHTSTWRGA